jgi:hypothetical protein
LYAEEDDVTLESFARELSANSVRRQLASMTDAERAGYDAVTAQLNKDHPVRHEDGRWSSAALEERQLLEEPLEVDVLDPTSAHGDNDPPLLRERVFDSENDEREAVLGCEDEDDQPVALSVHAVSCGGDFRIDASLYAILRAHQRSALDMTLARLANNTGIILAHGTGTGKTLTTLAAVHAYVQRHPDARFLVVCPKSLIFQWKNEMDKYPALGLVPHIFLKAGEQLQQTRRIWRQFGGVGIIGTEMFRTHVAELHLISEDVIIVDEAQQQLKATTTILHKALENTATHRRVLLSGSPLQNRIEELYNMVNVIEPGLLGSSYLDFYNLFGRVIESGIDRRSTNSQLRESKVMSHVLHRIVAERAAHFVSSEQVLKTAIPDRIDWLVLCEGGEPVDGGTEGLNAFQLRNFVHTHTLTVKIRMVALLLDEFARCAPTEQVVVFSARKETLRALAAARPGVSVLNGEMTSIEDRQKVIDMFRLTPGGVLYVGIQVGGVGLNLNFASRVILADISWNPMDDWQAIARSHRMGQTQVVRTYRLCVKGSVEERAYWLGVNKSFLAASIVNDQDVTRVYDMTELATVSIDPVHFVAKANIQRDPSLKRVALQHDWISIIDHGAVTAKQKNDTQLTQREAADATNQYNCLSTIAAPACYLSTCDRLSTRYRAGVEHIHIRLPVPNLTSDGPRATIELLHKRIGGSWQTWRSYQIVSSDGVTMRFLVLTSKDDPEMLTPGRHIFKVRLMNSEGTPLGAFSPTSAVLSVV